jgi:uroporphyrinogen-III synthase
VTPVNLDRDKIAAIVHGEVDAILFFSPTAVEHFVGIVGDKILQALKTSVAIAAVGPITANALNQAGVENLIVAAETTSDAVIAALEKHFAAEIKVAAGAKRE